ncbi:MAG: GNAT family N-acetyltransferase [Chlamydiales bacterium]|nr:GNAT family N-acetyltransferase [Chlamydiales bacterium]
MSTSSMSSIIEFSKKNAIPFVIGLSLGMLGTYLIKWLKSDSEPSIRNICILNLTENGQSTETLTFLEFKEKVTFQELNKLRKSVDWAERTDKIWNKVLCKSDHIVCVKKNEELIAYGCFVGNGRMGSIFDIHVDPKHQRQKIGTLVMNHLVEYIRTEEYTSVNLSGWEDNASVLEFYKKFGFESNSFAMESSGKDLQVVSSAL